MRRMHVRMLKLIFIHINIIIIERIYSIIIILNALRTDRWMKLASGWFSMTDFNVMMLKSQWSKMRG